MELEHLAVYSENCLQCSYLVEGAEKKFKKCHYSKGNDFCPASEVRIVVTGKIRRYLDVLAKARLEKNSKLEAKVWAAIGEESAPFQHRFYEALDDR